MTADPRAPRIWPAMVLAPLAAPIAIWVGLLLRILLDARSASRPEDSIASVAVLALVLIVLGAPLAYATTFAVLLPAFRWLEARSRTTWWTLALIGAAAGGIVFPLYLHWLQPRGSFEFFPGAGVLAGAATGVVFWWLATR
jgi:hypothetical protein